MPHRLHQWANPGRFQRISDYLLWPCTILAGILLIWGSIEALWLSPSDYRQGEAVRIMYIHVPSAWMALFGYAALAGSSAVFLVWRHPLASITADAIALPGIALTGLAYLTGSLWGKPTWGSYWVFDARMISVLVLFFFYLGYIVLRQAFDDEERGRKAAAILALVGVVDLPIIKWSVDWWNTLHQPASISRWGASAIDPSMMVPLLLMAAGYALYFIVVTLLGIRYHWAVMKLTAVRLRAPRLGKKIKKS